MSLNKTPVPINFSKGVQTKTDPYQLGLDEFANLKNSVFTKAGRLTKRNGYQNITNLPNALQTTLTTLNDNLIATGTNLLAYSKDTEQWIDKGIIQPVQLETQSMVRASTGQSAPDMAVAANGLACLVYLDTDGNYYYQMSDSTTGQQVVPRTQLPATAQDARVVVLGKYFIMTYIVTSGTKRIHYMAIPTASPFDVGIDATITTDVDATDFGYDIAATDENLYIMWGATGSIVKVVYLTRGLVLSATYNQAAAKANKASISLDPVNNILYASYWQLAGGGWTFALDLTLTPIMATTQWDFTGAPTLRVIVSVNQNRTVTIFQDIIAAYGYNVAIGLDHINRVSVTMPLVGVGVGTVSVVTGVTRAMGISSKPFIKDGVMYILAEYGNIAQANPIYNSNQPTYFLLDEDGNVLMRLAYSNGGGFAVNQVVPQVNFIGDNYLIPYLITDFLTTVNKGTSLPAGQPVNALYTQKGINLATFNLNIDGQYSSEIASALHLTGGQLWEYDGVKPVEHGFQVWPEYVEATTNTAGGLITAQTYYYVFTYEWTDNQGMLHRSAPSIPEAIVTTGATSTNTISVPTYRFTYKIAPNPVRIVGYRWSTAQQVYYQFTSVTAPMVNDTQIDYVTFVDTKSDAQILGTTLLYTTGGVVENTAASASVASALFNNRLFLINAENRNLLEFSKVVIQNVPVEMSDLLTIYVAPTTSAQGSTGPMYALGAMDDKLIIFKRDALYYINGTGPDNTGANSQYSDPVFITGTVGSTNPKSIVLIPQGLMFQSDKGIWLLGRDLSTTYVGAPVEAYNDFVVVSSEAIPGTNQVRFVLENNITLMYDYFFAQWSIHSNIKAISATLYNSTHTYLNSLGMVYQETPNTYKDGSVPVLMSLTTAWINVAGLQGYERFYYMHLLGTYYTPFKLDVQLAYNYNQGPSQSVIVLPDNYTGPWGAEALWGSGGPWGGIGNVFEARVFPEIQKCESFQVTINEIYDPSLGADAGQGLALSGLLLTVGVKKSSRTQAARRSFG